MPSVKVTGNVYNEKGKVEPGTVILVDEKDLTRLVGLGVAEEVEVVEEPPKAKPLSKMNVEELQALAKDAGIEGFEDLKKADLVKVLDAAAQEGDQNGGAGGSQE